MIFSNLAIYFFLLSGRPNRGNDHPVTSSLHYFVWHKYMYYISTLYYKVLYINHN